MPFGSEDKMRELAIRMLALLLLGGQSFAQSVNIRLEHGTDAEQHTKEELARMLATYDLSKYTFTHDVIIDEKAIPHSHPVLTLHRFVLEEYRMPSPKDSFKDRLSLELRLCHRGYVSKVSLCVVSTSGFLSR
jgi:hypothetical protein